MNWHIFFFNDPATTEISPLSLPDALPILNRRHGGGEKAAGLRHPPGIGDQDRKSTRLNSSHLVISYAVFCLKKRALSSIMVICMLTAIRLLLTFVMSLYLLLRS